MSSEITSTAKRLVMVAAVAENRVIGRDDDMPWHLPEDLKHFRAVTRDNTVVMGRVTFEGIGHPLPYRSNIVVTRQTGWSADGVFVAGSIEDAIELAKGFEGDIMIIGGAEVYAQAMPYADVQVLTEVHRSVQGDRFYPDFDRADWTETEREDHEDLSFVRYERAGQAARITSRRVNR